MYSGVTKQNDTWGFYNASPARLNKNFVLTPFVKFTKEKLAFTGLN